MGGGRGQSDLGRDARSSTARQPDLLLNVTLNARREITGVFAGDLDAAHAAGREFVRQSAMVKVDAPYDIVITTNSGYPLDQNLYQTVKGMSAASRIGAPGRDDPDGGGVHGWLA